MIYSNLSNKFGKTDLFQELEKVISGESSNLLFSGLPKSFKSFLVTHIWEKTDKNVLFITFDDKLAEDYMDDFDILAGDGNSFFLPDYEVLPYEKRSPHYSIRAQRIQALANAVYKKPNIFSLSISSFLRKITPKKIFEKNIKSLKIGEEINPEILFSELVSLGYEVEYLVGRVGDISRRGGIIDIYPPNLHNPVRIELFGDEIESIRAFDIETQKSTKNEIDKINILPAREFSIHDIPAKNKIWEKIPNADFYEGIENDLPLIFPRLDSIVDYFEKDNYVIIFDEFQYFEEKYEEILEETTKIYINTLEKDKFIPEPATIYQAKSKINRILKNDSVNFVTHSGVKTKYMKKEIFTEFKNQTAFDSDLSRLIDELEEKIDDNYRIFIQSDNESQKKRMQNILSDFKEKIFFTVGVFQKGFTFEEAKVAVYTDHEIFNRYKGKKHPSKYSSSRALIDYDSLNVGDYIVHINHGVGIFEGLRKMNISGANVECLVISYAKNDKIFVPTDQLNLVTKYVSEDGFKPKIHKIGGKEWSRTKQSAKKQIELVADDIVKLYAERKVRKGIKFDKDSSWQLEMENAFIYEDTIDQKRVSEEIKRDMEEDAPMERLLCGDVGFGKTEIAIRAAFKAVNSGFQVAVLVPTTLLAEQHYNVFKERLAQYPVNIEMFNRFRTNKRINFDILKLAKGEIDIAIGTHRLFSKDVQFKNIGLLIIDEEHRFGVQHKNRIRKKWSNIDTLYMSATPIPRTLSLALSKLKELSLMQTSPKSRLPIRTVITPNNDDVIKDAIKREVDRGGQVFFVHNRVKTIESIAGKLRKLLPNISFRVGHGQMEVKKLEKVMLDFGHNKFDVLVSTTIVENGIDIPNANTIIIDRSDRFGLAQLYQMRGRVGRSNRRAYAYLLIPSKLTDIARKRVETLTEYNSLGAGYQIAMRDLELRGAGSLLGNKQSGTINSVGFNFYAKLLNQAIDNIEKNNPDGIWAEPEPEKNIKMNIQADYYFPKKYISNDKVRLKLYQRLLEFDKEKDFENFGNEMIDRFGKLPEPVKNTIQYFKLKNMAKSLKLSSFNLIGGEVIISFKKKDIPPKKKIHNLIKTFDFPVSFDMVSGITIKLTLSKNAVTEREFVLKKTNELLRFLQNW